MKKTMLTILFFLIFSLPLCAEWAEGNGEFATDNVSDVGTANILVGFVNKIDDYVNIGFTGVEPSGLKASDEMPEDILSNISLVDFTSSEGKGIASNVEDAENDVYVFYQIVSSKELIVSLELQAPLEAKDTDPVSYLGWNLSWITPEEEGGDYQSGSISCSEDSTEGGKAPICSHIPPDDGYSSAGYKFLTISTDNYLEKATGKYEGNVIVRVDVYGG